MPGSNGGVVRQIARGGPVTVTDREVTRFFMTIPETSQLILQAATLRQGREIFILDMGQPVKIDDLARNMIRLPGQGRVAPGRQRPGAPTDPDVRD